MALKNELKFGLESEYIILNKNPFKPLWHKDVTFSQINQILEEIDISDMPSLADLELEPPHKKKMPFVVEGYHLPNMEDDPKELLPKGIEIRTPVCCSLDDLIQIHKTLHGRLKKTLSKYNLDITALSHHPVESEFEGPQNKRRHDYWQWSMEVMTTYGPDINVGVPKSVMDTVDQKDLLAKINYYAPALSALSVASPFLNSKPWYYQKNKLGHSYRMFKRSYIAPPIEIHPHENNRFEFKIFDMPSSLQEIRAQFGIFLALFFSDQLKGRAKHQDRIYQLGEVSKKGLAADGIGMVLDDFFEQASKTLESIGFDPKIIELYQMRFKNSVTPAKMMSEQYLTGSTLEDILIQRSNLEETSMI